MFNVVNFICACLDNDNDLRKLYSKFNRLFLKTYISIKKYSCPEHLGNLTQLTIWHNNGKQSPDWYIKQIIVKDTFDDMQ